MSRPNIEVKDIRELILAAIFESSLAGPKESDLQKQDLVKRIVAAIDSYGDVYLEGHDVKDLVDIYRGYKNGGGVAEFETALSNVLNSANPFAVSPGTEEGTISIALHKGIKQSGALAGRIIDVLEEHRGVDLDDRRYENIRSLVSLYNGYKSGIGVVEFKNLLVKALESENTFLDPSSLPAGLDKDIKVALNNANDLSKIKGITSDRFYVKNLKILLQDVFAKIKEADFTTSQNNKVRTLEENFSKNIEILKEASKNCSFDIGGVNYSSDNLREGLIENIYNLIADRSSRWTFDQFNRGNALERDETELVKLKKYDAVRSFIESVLISSKSPLFLESQVAQEHFQKLSYDDKLTIHKSYILSQYLINKYLAEQLISRENKADKAVKHFMMAKAIEEEFGLFISDGKYYFRDLENLNAVERDGKMVSVGERISKLSDFRENVINGVAAENIFNFVKNK